MSELQRRRELTALTKTQLIDFIIAFQNEVTPLLEAIEEAYGNEP